MRPAKRGAPPLGVLMLVGVGLGFIALLAAISAGTGALFMLRRAK